MFYIAFFRHYENINNIVGTDRQYICRDLKTLKGVLKRYFPIYNRMKEFDKRIEKMVIYSYTDIYNDKTYKFLFSVS